MIRVKAFLKYAGIQLTEIKSAFRSEKWDTFLSLCSDLASSLIKTIEVTISKESINGDRKALLKAVAELVIEKKEAQGITDNLLELLEKKDKVSDLSREEAKAMLEKAEYVYNYVKRLCLP